MVGRDLAFAKAVSDALRTGTVHAINDLVDPIQDQCFEQPITTIPAGQAETGQVERE